MRTLTGVVIGVALIAVGAREARAQESLGPFVSGSVAAAVDGGVGRQSLQGAVGYRLNRIVGIEFETTWMPLAANAPPNVGDPYLAFNFSNAKSQAFFLTMNTRLKIPTNAKRIQPYAVIGAGSALTRSTDTLTVSYTQQVRPGQLVTNQSVEDQAKHVALFGATLGGGVSLLVTDHVAIDVDLRGFYVRGTPVFSSGGSVGGAVGRFGIGTSYRF